MAIETMKQDSTKLTLSVIKADIGGWVGHADVLRLHGPFEPHRLPLDEMEYTTMPQIMKKLEGRWAKI